MNTTVPNSHLVRMIFLSYGVEGPLSPAELTANENLYKEHAPEALEEFSDSVIDLVWRGDIFVVYRSNGAVLLPQGFTFASVQEAVDLAEAVADNADLRSRCMIMFRASRFYRGKVYDLEGATFERVFQYLPDGGFTLTFEESRRGRLVRPKLVVGANFDWNAFVEGFSTYA